MSPTLQRNFALGIVPFTYADLYDPAALARLDAVFSVSLGQQDPALGVSFAQYRAQAPLDSIAEAKLLVAVGQYLGPFVARLFGIEAAYQTVVTNTLAQHVIFTFKREFIGKRVRKRLKDLADVQTGAYAALEAQLGGAGDPELRAARTAMTLLELYNVADRRPAASLEELAAAQTRVEALLGTPVVDLKATLTELLRVVEAWHAAQIAAHVPWVSYHVPHPIEPTHLQLVQLNRPKKELPEMAEGPADAMRRRTGFALTDPRMAPRDVLNQVDYCLYCHDRAKDSCRTGLHDKSGLVKHDPLGIALHGCPLDERISEAHTLRQSGDPVAALAMVCIDNPMCPGTGHRICNDCMKACIFQKQEPVNIPQIETSLLTDVLHLPFGFEIYSLLTRWNPLNRLRPTPLPYHGHHALVVGLGPAGYTLAHYLINEGFGVVGIDGLKLEPLPTDLTGRDGDVPRAIRDFSEISEQLDERVLRGFGGVAEYGITVRWDKNFLKVIYLNLARRQTFRAYGGIRFGGTITLDDAWAHGFHHVAIAAGAGKPTIVDMDNNLLNGMRAASDFLMALQLAGAYKTDTLANLQVELPAIVIGGGLTAIDTATELAAYYPVQVEKILARAEVIGEARLLSQCDDEERAILQRMLEHGRALRHELQQPNPNIPQLVRSWGGVSVAYRRKLAESPAYRLNHEEVQKALEEGIFFIEDVTPQAAVQDAFGHVDGLTLSRADKSEVTLPARSVMMAAGTSPNVIYEKEYPGTFALDERYKFFRAHTLSYDDTNTPILAPAQAGQVGFFTSYQGPMRRFVTYYGDNHPHYAGNVVKAMASAKHGYRHVARIFADANAEQPADMWQGFVQGLEDAWLARVHEVIRLTPTIIDVVVHAPLQARKFQPGQFFRLQNYDSFSPKTGDTRLTMEGLALTGAWVDKERGLLSLITLEMGASSRLCAMLQKGEEVVVMGPTGTPTDIPRDENIVLCGGGLGNAVLFSVAKAMRDANNRVVYFAGYRRATDLFKREDIESAADQIIWCVDAGPAIAAQRPQDRSFVGNIVEAMHAYGRGDIDGAQVPFADIDRIVAIGSDRMMAAVTRARRTVLAPYIKPHHVAIASINSPMQCMMKEVCAQCLQRHIDPVTGAESFVFSCFNQDQDQDRMDWKHLAARLRQNTVVEKVTNLWLDELFETHPVTRI